MEIGDLIVNIVKYNTYNIGTFFQVKGFGTISQTKDGFGEFGYCISPFHSTDLQYISHRILDEKFISYELWIVERKNIERDNKIDKLLS